MVDKLSVMDYDVHDSMIVLKKAADSIIKTINESKEKNFLDVNGIESLLDCADCINGWVNMLAINFLTTEKKD